MKLWTTMPARVYDETISKYGYYRCNPSKSELLLDDGAYKQFANAYDWLSKYMTEKIGAAPEGVKYPVWAWFRLRGQEKRPDLRWEEFSGAAEEIVLIEHEKEGAQVVLSDEVIWTIAQLNDSAWCETDEELDWYYDSNAKAEEKERFKKDSWYRIFDVKNSQHVQATFWELRKEDITKVWKYNTKK